ncbi:MAG: cytochrome c nitrite reductase small subunit [Bdellovibrionaceae bacterium]|nr:cytochrome c nitrite reductase small subunit [Pseudobdellovibrionaceae bacterium]
MKNSGLRWNFVEKLISFVTIKWMKLQSSDILLILISAFLGLASYGFFYAKGYSYMSDDPNACVNCHVMQDQMDSWQKSTHHHVAKCNDCHLPHNVVGKYAIKAVNGFNHSAAFTLQNFKDPIQIKEHSRSVVLNSCISCHEPMTANISVHKNQFQKNDLNCLNCHQQVGHGK